MVEQYKLKIVRFRKEKKINRIINKKDWNFLKMDKWNKQENIYQDVLLSIKELLP